MDDDERVKIIIDGADVAFWHGNGERFSSRGILLCLEYFKERKHQICVFAPFNWRYPRQLYGADEDADADIDVLEKLHKSGIVNYLPTNDNHKYFNFLVQTSGDMNAIIVTNNDENVSEDIKNRILNYTFADDNFYPDPNPNDMPLEIFLSGAHLKKIQPLVIAPEKKTKKKTTAELLASVLDVDDDDDDSYSFETTTSSSHASVVGKSTTCRNALLAGLEKNKNQKIKHEKNLQNLKINDSDDDEEKNFVVKNKRIFTNKNNTKNVKKFDDIKAKKLKYGVGRVTRVGRKDGYIETDGLKHEVKFSLASYDRQPNCDDLRNFFSVDESIVFSTGPVDEEGVMHATMVDRLNDVAHGYGKLVGQIRESTALVETQKCDRIACAERLFCPGSSFDKNEQLSSMKLEDWVEFYAVEQFLPTDYDGRKNAKNKHLKFVVVKANFLTDEGVFVKITPAYGLLWTKTVGLVYCSKTKTTGVASKHYKLGNWLSCQVRWQEEKNNCNWYAVSGFSVPAIASTTVDDDDNVEIMSCGTLGICTDSYGTVWCPDLGRVSICEQLLKTRPLSTSFTPMQKISFKAKCSSKLGYAATDYMWTAVEVHSGFGSLTDLPSDENDDDYVANVRMTLERINWKNNKASSAFFKSDKYGTIFARNVDCAPNFADWKSGDVVYGALTAQQLPNVVWRAFCVDKKKAKRNQQETVR